MLRLKAWVPLKTEHVRWQNRKKHTRPFVMPQGIPAIFITLDTKLDKYAEVWTSKHSSVPCKKLLPEKILFFFFNSLRVLDSLCCWHVKLDLDVLSLISVSSQRLVAYIRVVFLHWGWYNWYPAGCYASSLYSLDIFDQPLCAGCMCVDMNQLSDQLGVKSDLSDTSVICDVHLDDRQQARQEMIWLSSVLLCLTVLTLGTEWAFLAVVSLVKK